MKVDSLPTALRRLLLFLTCLGVALGVRATGASSEPKAKNPRARQALDAATRLQDAFASVAERVSPSVVCITSYVRQEGQGQEALPDTVAHQPGQWLEAGEPEQYPGFQKLHSGSGVIFGADCHVLTLRQFVIRPSGEPADLVDVELHNGEHLMSQVLGVEPTLNVAVLEFVRLAPRQLPPCAPPVLGDSDSLRVGYWTFALGDPEGPPKFFSSGVLAGLPERRCYQEQLSATYLQASLKLHPEAYGGPLVNIRGEIVGITTPRPPRQADFDGLEYALPINIVTPIYEGIRANKSLRSPWLGIAVLEIVDLRQRLPTPEAFRAMVRPRFGVYIDAVFDPSPASRGDIRAGDFLISFNGRRLFSVYRFQEQLHLTGIGRTAKLEIFRAGEILRKEIVVEERPEAARPK